MSVEKLKALFPNWDWFSNEPGYISCLSKYFPRYVCHSPDDIESIMDIYNSAEYISILLLENGFIRGEKYNINSFHNCEFDITVIIEPQNYYLYAGIKVHSKVKSGSYLSEKLITLLKELLNIEALFKKVQIE